MKRRRQVSTFWGLAVPWVGLALLGEYIPNVWAYAFSFLVSFAVADATMFYLSETGTGAKLTYGMRSECRIWIVLLVIVVASLVGA